MSSCMSFSDLFKAANGRDFNDQERVEFAALDQATRNNAVKALARQASGIRTEDRIWTDGVTYTAFWPDERLTGQAVHGNGFSTVNQTSDPAYPGGRYQSFGSNDPDGRHKSTFVEDAAGNSKEVSREDGGWLGGSFVQWAKDAFTRRGSS